MKIEEKILIASFAKLITFKRYDVKEFAKAIGVPNESESMLLLDEILSIDMKKPEIQYVLNNKTVLTLRSIQIITDYTLTNISIQRVHGDEMNLERRLQSFNGMPMYSDKAYLDLGRIILLHDEIWGRLNSFLFKEMNIDGQPDKLFEGQQSNFLEASREIVAWILLRSLDSFSMPLKDKNVKFGLSKMLDIISDVHIDVDKKKIISIYEKFQIKKRLLPKWYEIAIAFSYLGFKPSHIRNIATELQTHSIYNYTSHWKTKKTDLTQIFDNESQVVRKFLVNMNRVRTKARSYPNHIKKSMKVIKDIITTSI